MQNENDQNMQEKAKEDTNEAKQDGNENANPRSGSVSARRKQSRLSRGATLLSLDVQSNASTHSYLILCIRKMSWFFAWCLCTGWMLKFGREIGLQYRSGDPVTVTTYVDEVDLLRPIIKVCNNVFLDPKKILDFSGNAKLESSVQFLKHAINRKDVNDSGFVFDTPIENLLLLSSRLVNKFRLEMKDFMLACGNGPTYTNCADEFDWVLEGFNGCYQTKMKRMDQVGAFHSFSVLLYFDPDVDLGKYTSAIGAKVVVSQDNDKFSRGDGISLAPHEVLSISAHSVVREQEESLENSKCTSSRGLETFNFTGTPFKVEYSPSSCRYMCTSILYYSKCNCCPIWGMNVTNSECLEEEEKRNCILRVYKSDVESESEMTSLRRCLDRCIRKCYSHDYDLHVSRATHFPNPDYFVKELKNIIKSGAENSLASKILSKIESEEISAAEVAQNVAQINVYLKEENLVKKIKISPLLTFPTFLSNIGGLIGMWLGLSVISLLKLIEETFTWVQRKFNQLSLEDEVGVDDEISDI